MVMPLRTLNAPCETTGKKGLEVLCWAIAGTALGAGGAALYGTLCGAAFALILGNPSRILTLGTHLALCGAAAGALVGAFARVFGGSAAPVIVHDSRTHSRGKKEQERRIPFQRARAVPEPLVARCRFPKQTAGQDGFGVNDPSLN
jgi:hypothetical protein